MKKKYNSLKKLPLKGKQQIDINEFNQVENKKSTNKLPVLPDVPNGKYIINKSAALELVAYVAYWYELKTAKESFKFSKKLANPTSDLFGIFPLLNPDLKFGSWDFLTSVFKRYCSTSKTCAPLIDKVVFPTDAEYPKRFYYILKPLYDNTPIVISGNEFQYYINFIKNFPEFKPKALSVNIKECGVEATETANQEYKLQKLEGTNWNLYYHSVSSQNVIVKSVVSFDQFNMVKIIDYNTNLHCVDIYKGEFSLYETDLDYISLKLKFLPTKNEDSYNSKNLERRERNLQIFFYFPDGEGSFAIGEYHDLEDKIYSGPFILEKIVIADADLSVNEKNVYRTNSVEIPKSYRNFFSQEENRIRVIPKFTSKKIFDESHNEL